MKHEKPDPNVPASEKHPGAPPDEEKRRIGEDRTPGDQKPRRPVGNSALPDEPAVFPPHN